MSHAVSEAEIRDLIERWAKAVRKQDIEAVLAHHSKDMLMFHVPPPAEIRGFEAYRKTWPPFFDWHNRGAGVFDIVSHDVTAGDDVAFATALLRCGIREDFEKDPDLRLRLTVGVRKEADRWIIAHEHHSFPAQISQ